MTARDALFTYFQSKGKFYNEDIKKIKSLETSFHIFKSASH